MTKYYATKPPSSWGSEEDLEDQLRKLLLSETLTRQRGSEDILIISKTMGPCGNEASGFKVILLIGFDHAMHTYRSRNEQGKIFVKLRRHQWQQGFSEPRKESSFLGCQGAQS